MELSRDEHDDEFIPLQAIRGNKPNTTVKDGSRFGSMQRFVGIIVLVAMIALFCILRENNQEVGMFPSDITTQLHANVPRRQCPKLCKARLTQRLQHHGGDFLKPQELLDMANEARDNMIRTMKVNYGDATFKAMFEEPDGTSRGRTAFWGGSAMDLNETDQGPSKAKFRRKLMIKLLEVQSALQASESSVSGCNCTATSRRLQNRTVNKNEVSLPELPLSYSSFVWATGGHSAAAGHGNLYNESYTAYLERAVKDVFSSVGIDFVGRNYAMGGMASAPEIAMCQESLFGIDVDLISWDFGMTDGGNYWKILLYANRIGMHHNKPLFLGLNVDQYDHKRQLKNAEEQGFPVMHLSQDELGKISSGIPDMFGMSNEEMASVSPWARDFKCKETLEKGDPTCDAMKYSGDICPDREFKAGWHPGWRVMAMYGSIAGLFVSDLLIDSIQELRKMEPYDPNDVLAKLLHEEAAEYIKSRASTAPVTEDLVRGMIDYSDQMLVDQFSKMFRIKNVICHTALLPAEIRYLGILTETENVGPHDFERGVSQVEASADKASDDEIDKRQMRLVYEFPRPNCPVDLHWDYKDFFYTHQNDGWTTLTLPNEQEKAYYIENDGDAPERAIMLCFAKCDWGHCAPGEMQLNEIENGNLTLTVNGIAVTKVANIDDCGLLRRDDGSFHFEPSVDGKFELRALVKKAEDGMAEAFARISTIVIM